MRTAPRAAVAALVLSTGLAGGAVGAQTLTDAERAARADLVTRAQTALRAGQFAEALLFIERAERIGHTAGTRYVAARVHQAAGRPAAAFTSAEWCLGEVDLDTQTTSANRDALRQACQTLRDELAPRVGRLTVRVPAEAPADMVVRVGGAIVRPPNYNAPRAVEAGTVRVEAEMPGRAPWVGEVTVVGGGLTSIDVRVPPPPGEPSPPREPVDEPPPPTAVPDQTPPGDVPRPAGGTQRALGVVGLVLGGVGLAAGAVASGVLSSMSDTYSSDRCAYLQNPTAACQDDYGTMQTLHTLQWAGYVGGGALAAAGLVVLLTAPSRAPAVRVSLAPGAASIAYGGSF